MVNDLSLFFGGLLWKKHRWYGSFSSHLFERPRNIDAKRISRSPRVVFTSSPQWLFFSHWCVATVVVFRLCLHARASKTGHPLIHICVHMFFPLTWGFPKWGYPNSWMVDYGKSDENIDDLGLPPWLRNPHSSCCWPFRIAAMPLCLSAAEETPFWAQPMAVFGDLVRSCWISIFCGCASCINRRFSRERTYWMGFDSVWPAKNG